ncbi:hypothetical protein ZIOFF_002023 [Zingiber officinale]|uniref:Uncharacterized protein n=1 Tax=Zingiber officinale TaxID=94328 RepID=A0A8J5IL91_ZINOF|nr:hypothetical protein ZIOFF_002023 [Zingiber officinale]
MSKFAALFVVALLLLNGTLSRAARPAPADPSSKGRRRVWGRRRARVPDEENSGGTHRLHLYSEQAALI